MTETVWRSIVAITAGAMLGMFLAGLSTESKPAETVQPLGTEYWMPVEPPRLDVACWRSGHAVVCLPHSALVELPGAPPVDSP